ncbi:MAG TPA: peptidoglycan-binding domain-containing protein [Alphaproteobacteria bacterium]|nr:peptidoglycan-binding domain-containing protein [Alphaproteobacteria bacterium]
MRRSLRYPLGLTLIAAAAGCAVPSAAAWADQQVPSTLHAETVGGVRLTPALIAGMQAELAARGFYFGPIDGLVGPQTRRAVRRYRVEEGLPATPEIDARVLRELGLIAGLWRSRPRLADSVSVLTPFHA